MRNEPAQSQKQSGFTLIELIIVIVIIGILAAVALPQFLNVSDDAKKGVANGIAGAFASAAATNYAACQGTLASCKKPVTCNTASLTLLVEGAASGASVAGTAAACTVTKDTATSDPVLIKEVAL